MKKFTILVDMDDTIEDLLGAWCNWLNSHYGTSFQKEEITEWDLSKKFAPLKREQIFEPLTLPEFWETVRPLPYAQDYLWRLIDDGHDVYIVTATHYANVALKYKLVIERWFPYVDWEHVIIAQDKQMVRGDILIDDGPHNHGEHVGILVDAPHNRDVNCVKINAIRAKDWREIYNMICTWAYDEVPEYEERWLAMDEEDFDLP